VLVLPAFTHGNVCRRQQNNQGNATQEWQCQRSFVEKLLMENKGKKKTRHTPTPTTTDKYTANPVQSNLRISVIKMKGFSLKTIRKVPGWTESEGPAVGSYFIVMIKFAQCNRTGSNQGIQFDSDFTFASICDLFILFVTRA